MTRRVTAPTPLTPPGGHVPRYRDRIFDVRPHDPCRSFTKAAATSRCPKCGAVHDRKRWRWGTAPKDALERLCPACRRIEQNLPAGVLTLDGAFIEPHKNELIHTARNEAQHEVAEHPLHRIMQIAEHDGVLEISTTDVHLPQRIGEALKRSHDGDLTLRYGPDEYSVRVRWHR